MPTMELTVDVKEFLSAIPDASAREVARDLLSNPERFSRYITAHGGANKEAQTRREFADKLAKAFDLPKLNDNEMAEVSELFDRVIDANGDLNESALQTWVDENSAELKEIAEDAVKRGESPIDACGCILDADGEIYPYTSTVIEAIEEGKIVVREDVEMFLADDFGENEENEEEGDDMDMSSLDAREYELEMREQFFELKNKLIADYNVSPKAADKLLRLFELPEFDELPENASRQQLAARVAQEKTALDNALQELVNDNQWALANSPATPPPVAGQPAQGAQQQMAKPPALPVDSGGVLTGAAADSREQAFLTAAEKNDIAGMFQFAPVKQS